MVLAVGFPGFMISIICWPTVWLLNAKYVSTVLLFLLLLLKMYLFK